MPTQTIDRQKIKHTIDVLSDTALEKLAPYVAFLKHEDWIEEQEDAKDIAALEAKYGTTPNAETIAAMEEAEAGGGEVTTIDEIMAELNAGN